jgi:hypothetical protein
VSHQVGQNARFNTIHLKLHLELHMQRKRGKSVRHRSVGCERVQALAGEEIKDSDYLFHDDHNLTRLTTGSASVRLYSRIMFCVFCYFSINVLTVSSKARELL